MSEIKAGDKIYFQGNQGEVMRVISDENEPLLEVVLTQKRVAYLNPSQLDLYPFAEQFNEQQQIAINNAKKSFEKGADLYDCAIDMMLYDGLTDKEWAKATLVFLLWVQKQEEAE